MWVIMLFYLSKSYPNSLRFKVKNNIANVKHGLLLVSYVC